MKSEKIIITGANGFIGSQLISRFQKPDRFEIIAVDIHKTLSGKYNFGNERIKYIILDEFLLRINEWTDAACIFHVGAISSTTETDWAKINFYNIYFSKKIIQFAIENKIHLVFTSSASVYGHHISFNIENVGNVYSQYAYSKLITDRYIRKLLRHGYQNLTCLRLYNVYGSNEHHKGNQASPFFKFKEQAICLREISLFENSGDYLRDFIAVEDVVELMYAVFQKKIYGTYNVGTGQAHSFYDVADAIAQKYNARLKWIKMPENLKHHYQIYTKAENTELIERTGEYVFRKIDEML